LAYPVLAGVGFALITLTANWFFGERLGISQYLGLGMIIVGIIFMAKQ
jgi:multidrug transporter EmrE-like cation transporter